MTTDTASNSKLQGLLLKVRKGSTAAFNATSWKAVLEAMGFTVIIDKTGREITRFTAALPTGEICIEEKMSGYRHIVFYELEQWGRDYANFSDRASAALGMPTVEAEKATKEIYNRDWTNTGTCGICGSNVKRDSEGGLVHHGYTRPGDGYISGDCFGVHYQPHELSPKAAQDFVNEVLIPELASTNLYLQRLQAGEVKSFLYSEFRGREVKEITEENDARRFRAMLEEAILLTNEKSNQLQECLRDYSLKVSNWKLEILPEIKYAGQY